MGTQNKFRHGCTWLKKILASVTGKDCWDWCECDAHKYKYMVGPCTDTDISSSMETGNQALPSVDDSKIKGER